MSLKREPHWTQASNARLTNVFRHYNNNLTLKSQPRKTPNWCTWSPCLWNRGLLCIAISLLKSTDEVYKLYPPHGLNLWPPKRKHMFLSIRPLSVQTIYDPPWVELKTTIGYWYWFPWTSHAKSWVARGIFLNDFLSKLICIIFSASKFPMQLTS